MYLSQPILFDVQDKGTKFLSRKIFVNIDSERHFDYIFSDMHASIVFQM